MIHRLCTAAAFALALAVGCSDATRDGGHTADPSPGDDASLGDDADAATPVADCHTRQREYVNTIIVPDEQIDVSTTVAAVLQAENFPQGMPYCSGSLPVIE